MRRFGMLAVTVLATAAMSGSMLAQPGPRDHRGEPGDHAKRMAKFLELTESQKEHLKALHEDFREANAATFEEMRKLHKQAREQMKSGDREAAKETRQKIRELRAGLKDEHQEMRSHMKEILTAEQLEKLDQLKERKSDRCRHRKGKRDRGVDRPEVAPQSEPAPPSID